MKTKIFVSSLAALFAADAMAAAGTQSVNTLLQTILSTLQSISPITITIAIIWVAYVLIFSERVTLSRMAPPIIGGILLGVAPWIADLLVG